MLRAFNEYNYAGGSVTYSFVRAIEMNLEYNAINVIIICSLSLVVSVYKDL